AWSSSRRPCAPPASTGPGSRCQGTPGPRSGCWASSAATPSGAPLALPGKCAAAPGLSPGPPRACRCDRLPGSAAAVLGVAERLDARGELRELRAVPAELRRELDVHPLAGRVLVDQDPGAALPGQEAGLAGHRQVGLA